jgi:hypothetical protein
MFGSLLSEIIPNHFEHITIEDGEDIILGAEVMEFKQKCDELVFDATLLSRSFDDITEAVILRQSSLESGYWHKTTDYYVEKQLIKAYTRLGYDEAADKISLEGESLDGAKGLLKTIWSAIRKFFAQIMNFAKKYWLKGVAWFINSEDKINKLVEKLNNLDASSAEKIEKKKVSTDFIEALDSVILYASNAIINPEKIEDMKIDEKDELKIIIDTSKTSYEVKDLSSLKNVSGLVGKLLSANVFKTGNDNTVATKSSLEILNEKSLFSSALPKDVKDVIEKKSNKFSVYLIYVSGRKLKFFIMRPTVEDSDSKKTYFKYPYYKVFTMHLKQNTKSSKQEITKEQVITIANIAKDSLSYFKDLDLQGVVDKAYEILKELKEDAENIFDDDDDLAEEGSKAVAVKNLYIGAGDMIYSSVSNTLSTYKNAIKMCTFILKYIKENDKSKEEIPKLG